MILKLNFLGLSGSAMFSANRMQHITPRISSALTVKYGGGSTTLLDGKLFCGKLIKVEGKMDGANSRNISKDKVL